MKPEKLLAMLGLERRPLSLTTDQLTALAHECGISYYAAVLALTQGTACLDMFDRSGGNKFLRYHKMVVATPSEFEEEDRDRLHEEIMDEITEPYDGWGIEG